MKELILECCGRPESQCICKQTDMELTDEYLLTPEEKKGLGIGLSKDTNKGLQAQIAKVLRIQASRIENPRDRVYPSLIKDRVFSNRTLINQASRIPTDQMEALAKYLYNEAGRAGGLDWEGLWDGHDLKCKCRRQAKEILQGKQAQLDKDNREVK